MDRRVKYTRKVLNESLIHFLEHKDISRITVTELCAMADINRSTYYVHFSDPYDQLAKLKEDLLGDLASYAKTLDAENLSSGDRPYQVLKSILQYVDSKKQIFCILLSGSGDRQLQHDILSILGEIAFPMDSALNPEEKEALMIYTTNGCFGLFFNWLMSDTLISTEHLAHLMSCFTLAAICSLHDNNI